jgi:hypothetical protein
VFEQSMGDLGFVSALEAVLNTIADERSAADIVEVAGVFDEAGFDASPWVNWKAGPSEDLDVESCACKLYYPATEQRWFDKSAIGSAGDGKLGSNPESIEDLRRRLAASRQASAAAGMHAN